MHTSLFPTSNILQALGKDLKTVVTLLLYASGLICIGVAVPLLVPSLSIGMRTAWRVTMLVILTVFAQRISGSPFRPVFYGDPFWLRLWQQCIIVGWWILAARGGAEVALLLLSMRRRSRETKILSELIGAAIYSAAVLAVIDIVFEVPVGGLVATSGIIAVVIGLALQSTLSDVFSGIAIDAERPYRAGDHLSIEGGIEGRVREVNWRSTIVVTGGGDIAVVPNSVMAKSRLVNHSLPEPVRRLTVEIRIDPRVLPERCTAALEAAVRACLLPMTTPAPTVSMTALQGDGAVYEISMSVAASDKIGAARTELLAQAQRHLLHAAIPLAVAGIPVLPDLDTPTITQILAHSDLFRDLDDDDRALLASRMSDVSFEPDTILFEQGDEVDALYLVSSGTIGILRRQADGSELVRRMSPGSCIGIIGLITQVPFAATAQALTPVSAFRLDAAGLAQAIGARPNLASSLEKLAARSKAALRLDAAADASEERSSADAFSSRLRAFLRRLAS